MEKNDPKEIETLDSSVESREVIGVKDKDEIELIEMKVFLEAVFLRYGFDFRDYAPASMRRRVWNAAQIENLETISKLQDRVLHDPACMERFLLTVSVDVTTMFRDPGFYTSFREKVVPILRTYPFVRIWHAGCSSGEEVYSMAILLLEEGLYEKCRIYATDMNEVLLKKAKGGIFPIKQMQDYTNNYIKAGGKGAFSDYYVAKYESAIFSQGLKKNIIFSQHNLVTDGVFNEFNVIFCRNVMIYFNNSLQERVHDLFYKSLVRFGILGLGRREILKFSKHEKNYEELDGNEKLYRRIF